jgi:hypothetical protein
MCARACVCACVWLSNASPTDMALGREFLERDRQGCIGGSERGFMSTSPKRDVALGYTGILKDKDVPTLFEIEVGKTSIGADVSELSQFEAEKEVGAFCCYARTPAHGRRSQALLPASGVLESSRPPALM